MRTAFYISDGTAITSEVFGHATLSLFPIDFNHKTIPFVETDEKAHEIKALINATAAKTGEKPFVFFRNNFGYIQEACSQQASFFV